MIRSGRAAPTGFHSIHSAKFAAMWLDGGLRQAAPRKRRAPQREFIGLDICRACQHKANAFGLCVAMQRAQQK
jgi:hypothetical protein